MFSTSTQANTKETQISRGNNFSTRYNFETFIFSFFLDETHLYHEVLPFTGQRFESLWFWYEWQCKAGSHFTLTDIFLYRGNPKLKFLLYSFKAAFHTSTKIHDSKRMLVESFIQGKTSDWKTTTKSVQHTSMKLLDSAGDQSENLSTCNGKCFGSCMNHQPNFKAQWFVGMTPWRNQ